MIQTFLLNPSQSSMFNTKRNVSRAHHGMPLWALMSEGLPPLLLTAIRFAIAALAILPLVWRSPDCD